MDAIFPYLIRHTPAAEPSQRLIEPVSNTPGLVRMRMVIIMKFGNTASVNGIRSRNKNNPSKNSPNKTSKPRLRNLLNRRSNLSHTI